MSDERWSMRLTDQESGYGWGSWLLHWPSAVAIFGLFALGLYMRSLDYYHPWYHQAPELHKQIGMLLAGITLLRLGWRLFNDKPPFETTLARWEKIAADLAHWLLYLLLLATLISGYLIATGGGQEIVLIDWLTIPSLVKLSSSAAEEMTGELHEIFSYLLVGLALLHTLAACKHHWFDRDRTLMRMLWPASISSSTHHSEKTS